MSLENPFSPQPILPPEKTDPKANAELIASLLGESAGKKYQELLSGATPQPTKEKPDFDLDSFDEASFDTHELENKLDLAKQYETQRAIFQSVGLLEQKEGILGMTDIEGTFHPFPTFEEVRERIQSKQEIVNQKEKQGFKKLLLVPFGMSLQKFTETVKKTLLAHYDPDPTKTRLFSTNQDGTRVPLKLDTNQPLYVWDQYDEKNIAYFPQAFDQKNHRGKTKRDLLKDHAYHIILLEEHPDIPREGNGHTIGERPQLETNHTPNDYLKLLQENEAYQNEQGLTPEAWLTYFLLRLEQTNEVIDDYRGNGSINYNLGAYFPASGGVSNAVWFRVDAQAFVDRFDPSLRNAGSGCRSAVMV